MKKILISIAALLFSMWVWPQVPEKMSYQAIVRNSNNELIKNTPIGLKISLVQDSVNGRTFYSETHTPATDENGLISVAIGGGIGFYNIDWSAGPYFIKTEIDPAGGTNYTIAVINQMANVPYALHAKDAENISGTLPETDPVFGASAAAGITEDNMQHWDNKQNQLYAGTGVTIKDNVIALDPSSKKLTVDDVGIGIAANYPADEGIEEHESVIFTETFEAKTLSEVVNKWTWSSGKNDHRLTLDAITGPEGTPGSKSLKMTVLRNEGGEAGSLRKIFDEGYNQLFFRFYVKFAEDYGYNHHFTSMSGVINPTRWGGGNAGKKPDNRFGSAIDQLTGNTNRTGPGHAPPGYWMFYTYWPEMRSWQNVDGTPDGRPNPYYGNVFMPNDPIAAKRGEWQCIEIMIRLNTAPGVNDGAQSFWIDGELAGHWDPLEEDPVKGYWIREVFRHDPEHPSAEPFPGYKWNPLPYRKEFEQLKINIIKLQNYVSGTSWKHADQYAAKHPDFKINLQEATVWKDHIVVATEYIGPIRPKK